jgi:hypothetical protein
MDNHSTKSLISFLKELISDSEILNEIENEKEKQLNLEKKKKIRKIKNEIKDYNDDIDIYKSRIKVIRKKIDYLVSIKRKSMEIQGQISDSQLYEYGKLLSDENKKELEELYEKIENNNTEIIKLNDYLKKFD